MPATKPRITVYLDPIITEWVEHKSQGAGRSKSDIVASALADWLEPENHCIKIPQVPMEAIQGQAERNFRTVNQEILAALARAMDMDIRDVMNALNEETKGEE